MTDAMREATAQFYADCANAELRVTDDLLRRVLDEGRLPPELAGLVARVLERHAAGTMTSPDDREACRPRSRPADSAG